MKIIHTTQTYLDQLPSPVLQEILQDFVAMNTALDNRIEIWIEDQRLANLEQQGIVSGYLATVDVAIEHRDHNSNHI